MAVEEPRVTQEDEGFGSRVEHPAYAMIGAARVSAQPGINLFGSDHPHSHYVVVELHDASLRRSLNRDSTFAGKAVVRVAMSESQWAAFVSSMNVGNGVPCTAEFIAGRGYLPTLPPRNSAEIHSKEVLADLEATIASVLELKKLIETHGAKLPRASRDVLVKSVERLEQDIRQNLPYALQTFSRHMEKSVDKARTEVDAYVLNSLVRAGLASTGADGRITQRDGASPLSLTADHTVAEE